MLDSHLVGFVLSFEREKKMSFVALLRKRRGNPCYGKARVAS